MWSQPGIRFSFRWKVSKAVAALQVWDTMQVSHPVAGEVPWMVHPWHNHPLKAPLLSNDSLTKLLMGWLLYMPNGLNSHYLKQKWANSFCLHLLLAILSTILSCPKEIITTPLIIPKWGKPDLQEQVLVISLEHFCDYNNRISYLKDASILFPKKEHILK